MPLASGSANPEDARYAKVKALFYRSLFGCFDFCVQWVLRRRATWNIQAGPFQGMRWGAVANCSLLTPKLLGTYEQELHGWIEQLPGYDLVIDIGAAEGWYAVGFLHRHLARKVVAFEMTEDGRENLRANVRRNAVPPHSIEIRGECTIALLQALLNSLPAEPDFRLLIISDCEGFEDKLLAADTVKLCPNACFIIETHDFFVPGVRERLAKTLAPSHTVTDLRPARRNRKKISPNVPWLFRQPFISRLLMSERRCPGIAWLVAVPKIADK